MTTREEQQRAYNDYRKRMDNWQRDRYGKVLDRREKALLEPRKAA